MTSPRGILSRSALAVAVTGVALTGTGSAAVAAPHPGTGCSESHPTAAKAKSQAKPEKSKKSSTISLPDGIQPEGISSAGSRYFAGSMNDGRIVTGTLTKDRGSRVLTGPAQGRQIRGLFYASQSKLLWAVGNVGSEGHVYAVNARNGEIVSDTLIPGAMFLNDVVVTKRGVYVTDSQVERLTRITIDQKGRPTGADPQFIALGGDWPGAQGGLSANGIRRLDAGHVLLDHSTAGGLWSVDVLTGKAVEVPVKGGPAITGGDGLERQGSTLWVVRGTDDSSVAELRLKDTSTGWTARFRQRLSDPSLDVPSTATFAAGRLNAVNARFGTSSPSTATYSITRLKAHAKH